MASLLLVSSQLSVEVKKVVPFGASMGVRKPEKLILRRVHLHECKISICNLETGSATVEMTGKVIAENNSL